MTAPDTEFPSKFSDLQWGKPKAYNQLSVVSPRTTDGGGYISYSNVTISLGDLYYITDGLADYLESHEHKELDVPGTYSDFDSFPGFVSEVTARGRNGAKGLTQYKLEDAVRFAAGKGRFRSGDLTVYGVKNALSIVQYDGDAFAVKNADLAMPDNPVTTEINGIDIPEENSALISGIRRLMNVLETQFEAAVTGYKRPSNHGHVFETETGTDVTVHQSTLRQLSSCSESADDVLREYSRETVDGEEVRGEWESLKHEIGEEVRGGIVVGYAYSFHDPRTSASVSMSGRVKLSEVYVALRLTHGELGVSDSVNARSTSVKETIAEFRPPKEDQKASAYF